ncbi:hypothetical protein JCM19037_4490 [Geomicrobium sp. JCM 19037]|uniref:hypothetical protein n=1 Tax=unclassified Geomicrobium TaxID=2628951 RepID=UPI00045F44D7|nr:hypothetical protein [Geomicrobium sp. JCM 19037]GAK05950.1 hypothetical protein JCM19037_4490 [Geomicrobium sp. JCM 19037]
MKNKQNNLLLVVITALTGLALGVTALLGAMNILHIPGYMIFLKAVSAVVLLITNLDQIFKLKKLIHSRGPITIVLLLVLFLNTIDIKSNGM